MSKAQNSKPRLWVVTELYYPEETSTGYYLTRIAEGLTDIFDVKVICGQPNYSARGIKAPARERHREVEIFRVAGTTLDKNRIPYRLINMLSLSVSTFLKALFNFKKGDQILVVTTPPSLPFITAAAAKICRAAYTLLIHDNYPEILIAVGKTTRRIISFKNFERGESAALQKCRKNRGRRSGYERIDRIESKKLKSKNSGGVYFKLGGAGTCLARAASGKPAFTKIRHQREVCFFIRGQFRLSE
jgi:hypothetical protein